ncbi:MAG: NAD(P)H-dependent oxidoreductase [Ostreibacterium sp.]
MSLFTRLTALDTPLRIGLIGAGKFGSMYLAQVLRTPNVHLVGIVDLNPAQAMANLAQVGWDETRYSARSLDVAIASQLTYVGDDALALINHPSIDIIIECTGNSIVAVEHCLLAFDAGKDVINVTVEADAFCGPLLARKAAKANVIYSLAYGDQPALAAELIDWARMAGFSVVAAGRGHKWLPHYRESTPETVWDYWGLTKEQAQIGRLNPKMFNAFLDGTKPAIETACIANIANLAAPTDGLAFPPGSIDDIANLMRPISEGGVLEKKGLVEAISCIQTDGTPIPHDIRKGVWVSVEAGNEYIERCFKEYSVTTDTTGKYMCQYKKWHLIGLELGISVANVGIRREATGTAKYFNADVVATAKHDLQVGELLDGEGGYTVFGKLVPAATSLAQSNLPLGVAHHLKVIRPVKKDQLLTWDDVLVDETLPAVKIRREIESIWG